MLIEVHVIPKASKNEITPQGTNSYKVKLTAPPTDNKANEQLISLISKSFHCPKSAVKIIKGLNSRKKLLQIGDA